MSNEKLTRDQQREAARAKAKAMREAQKKNEGRKKIALISTISVVAAALVTVVVIALTQTAVNGTNDGAEPKTAFTNGGFTVTKDLVLASNAAAIDKTVPTIVIYEDLQCPACKAFELPNMPQITELVKAGKYNLEIHPIGMLDGFSANEYASRAASALVCVAEGAPAAFLDYNTALYSNQPDENTAGPENAALAELASSVGVQDAATLSCIKKATWANWTKNQVPAYQGTVPGTDIKFNGTPTVIVNGQQYQGELTNAAMFLQWLQTVAPVSN